MLIIKQVRNYSIYAETMDHKYFHPLIAVDIFSQFWSGQCLIETLVGSLLSAKIYYDDLTAAVTGWGEG